MNMERKFKRLCDEYIEVQSLSKATIHFFEPRSVLVALEVNPEVTQSCAHKTRYQNSGFLKRQQKLYRQS